MSHDREPAPTRPSLRTTLRLEGKRASAFTLSTFVTQLGGFLIVPLFWHRLSPSDYGIIAVTELIGVPLGILAGLSLDLSVTRLYYEWPETERKRRVGAIWIASWASSVAVGCACVIVLSPASSLLFPDVPFHPFIQFGIIIATLKAFSAVPFATIRIKQLPGLYSAFSIASFAAQMGLSVYFVIILDRGVDGYFVAQIASNAINAVALFAIMARFATPRLRGGQLRESLRFALPLIPSNLVTGTSSLIDRFILQQYASVETVGIYAISLKFANLIAVLHSALKMSFIPSVIEALSKDRAAGVHRLAQMSSLYSLVILIQALAIAAFAEDVVVFAGRPAYLPVVAWVPWLIWPVVLQCLHVYVAPGLFLAKRTNLMWIPAVAQLVAVVASGMLLIPQFQLPGVVGSRYCSAAAFFFVSLALSQRHFPMPLPWGRLAVVVALAIVGTIALAAVGSGHALVGMAVKASVVAGVALLCLLIIRTGEGERSQPGVSWT